MLILIDLDGTLINTVHPTWKPYKDGQDGYSIEPHLAHVPFFSGVKEFFKSRKAKGDDIVVVSDSHFCYVAPICKMFDVEYVALADKPNTTKLNEFLDKHSEFKEDIDNGNCVVIGDTKLDIEFGRHIGVQTIWFLPYRITKEIMDERDGIGDVMAIKKMGPTFTAKTFAEIENILDSPLTMLCSVESAFEGTSSVRAIRYSGSYYADGSFACIRCLARQENGACDKYARADKYYLMGNPARSQDLLKKLASGISNYLNQPCLIQRRWDYFTYLTDKKTTTPPNKMKEIFDMVETSIPKVRLLKWSDDVSSSLREQNLYQDRQAFLQKYLSVECPWDKNIEKPVENTEDGQQRYLPLLDRNIVVLDDQLTTAATAWHIIRELKNKGARNVLFVTFFQMILPVNNDMVCPKCGKPMCIKIRRTDGHRFYSCVPPEFRGEGCGYIQDILEQ